MTDTTDAEATALTSYRDAPDSESALLHLRKIWRQELRATRKASRARLAATTLSERVRQGYALDHLEFDELEAKAGGRALLWFRSARGINREQLKLNAGEPVLIWQGSPDGEWRERGVLAKWSDERVGVMVEGQYDAFLEAGELALDREAPEVTFERGKQAIERFLKDKDLRRSANVLYGFEEPRFERREPEVKFRDESLNQSQQAAVRFAMRAQDIALIHGPPGTGKTQTLVEVVRQALRRQQSVLVTAASNTAVDNLTERLIQSGLKPLRLGHPARVSAAVEARTLDALIEETEESQLAKQWLAQARDLRSRQHKRQSRGALNAAASYEMKKEAKRLSTDARRSLDAARAKVLRRCRVVCATAGGVDISLLGETRFDWVVLDEATQAQDPVALAALERGKIWVLAGDPQQLPPTVVDREAGGAGLQTTFFERLNERFGETITRMLTVQYRMHEALIQFPSDSMYGGRLETDASVKTRKLADLPNIKPDAERPGSWVFIDTAGAGFEEEQQAEDASLQNPRQAECTASEVRRLLARGLSPKDVAAITPYSAQAKLLRRLLQAEVEKGLEIGTVDGFQGREKEAVVVDFVRSNAQGQVGFLADIRRSNVAITRARSFLAIIGDSATLSRHDYYRSLVTAAENAGVWRSAAE